VKFEIKSILIFVLFISYLNSSIVIKLGSYSNKDNIKRELLKLDNTIKNSNSIIFEDNLYRAYSKVFDNEIDAKAKLELYRKVFNDAYIMHTTNNNKQIKHNIVINKNPTIKKIENIDKEKVINKEDILTVQHSSKIIKPINTNTLNSIKLTKLLIGRTLYFAPNKITKNSQKMLIKISFEKGGIVNYTPIMGKFPPLSMRYYIEGEKLYITRSTPNPYQFIKLEEIFFEYYLLSKYSMGKKISMLRYYTNQENAQAYLNSFRF